MGIFSTVRVRFKNFSTKQKFEHVHWHAFRPNAFLGQVLPLRSEPLWIVHMHRYLISKFQFKIIYLSCALIRWSLGIFSKSTLLRNLKVSNSSFQYCKLFNFKSDLFSWYSWGRCFCENKSPQKFTISTITNESSKRNVKFNCREQIFHRQNMKINSRENK